MIDFFWLLIMEGSIKIPLISGRRFFKVFLFVLITRVIIFAFGEISNGFLPDRKYPYASPYLPKSRWVQIWFRWDTNWYVDIAKNGYTYRDGFQSNVAFFPLYPWTIKFLSPLIPNPYIAGVVISNICLLLALFLFHYYMELRRKEDDIINRALIYILIYPTSLFFSTTYSESMFLLFVVLSFIFYEREKYCWCGVFGYLATFTRQIGICLFPAFLLDLLFKIKFKPSQIRAQWFFLLFIFLAHPTVMIIHKIQVGEPLAFYKTQDAWGRSLTTPVATIIKTIKATDIKMKSKKPFDDYNMPASRRDFQNLMDLFFFFFFIIIGVYALFKDIAWGIYILTVPLLAISSGLFASIIRYVMVLFPGFILLSEFGKNKYIDTGIKLFFSLFLGVFTMLYTLWHWGGA